MVQADSSWREACACVTSWTRKNRETRAGVTIHKLDDGLDTGDIVLTEMIRLEKSDTYGLLTAKLAKTAASMITVILKLVDFDVVIPSKPQDESKAVYYKKQGAKDVSIDWHNMDADCIIALINAGNPWNKGAVSKLNGKIIRLLEGEKSIDVARTGSPAGTIISLDGSGLSVSTNDGQVIRVRIVFTDEGFFSADRLSHLGVQPGARFEHV